MKKGLSLSTVGQTVKILAPKLFPPDWLSIGSRPTFTGAGLLGCNAAQLRCQAGFQQFFGAVYAESTPRQYRNRAPSRAINVVIVFACILTDHGVGANISTSYPDPASSLLPPDPGC